MHTRASCALLNGGLSAAKTIAMTTLCLIIPVLACEEAAGTAFQSTTRTLGTREVRLNLGVFPKGLKQAIASSKITRDKEPCGVANTAPPSAVTVQARATHIAQAVLRVFSPSNRALIIPAAYITVPFNAHPQGLAGIGNAITKTEGKVLTGNLRALALRCGNCAFGVAAPVEDNPY